MENAVVYARYSSHSQTEQSIEGQLAAARRYAQDKGYKIIKEYVDRAKTGTNDNREEFQRMLKDSNKKKFSVIIVWKVDRFGRNREEITFNKYKVKKNGVRVEYVAENISSGPEGVILESVLEGMAEYYSLQLSQNVSRGYVESAKKRHVIGMPPLGYDKGEDKKYTINESEANLVRLIFTKYNEGESQFSIINFLNSHGYKNKRGLPFKRNSIQRILTDDRYIGIYRFKGKILDETSIPPIVSREVFEATKLTAKEHKKMSYSNWNYSEYKLSNKLYCGKCGGKIKGSSGNGKNGTKYLYYICPDCKKLHLRSDKIDTIVTNKLNTILNDAGIIKEISEKVYEYYKENDETDKEIKRLQNAIADVDKRTSNILKSIEDGLDYSLCKNRLDELKSQKEELQAILTNTELSLPIKLTPSHIEYFLLKMKDNSKIIDTFINSITAFDDYLLLSLNYTNNGDLVRFSTEINQMGQMNHQSNFIIYKEVIVFKMKI